MNRDSPRTFCAKGRPSDQLSFLSERAPRPSEIPRVLLPLFRALA